MARVKHPANKRAGVVLHNESNAVSAALISESEDATVRRKLSRK